MPVVSLLAVHELIKVRIDGTEYQTVICRCSMNLRTSLGKIESVGGITPSRQVVVVRKVFQIAFTGDGSGCWWIGPCE